MGQSAAALQLLSIAAQRDFGPYGKGTFLQITSASGLAAASVMLALMLLGLDIFWLIFSLYALFEGTVRNVLSFSMSWWSTIFPVGK